MSYRSTTIYIPSRLVVPFAVVVINTHDMRGSGRGMRLESCRNVTITATNLFVGVTDDRYIY